MISVLTQGDESVCGTVSKPVLRGTKTLQVFAPSQLSARQPTFLLELRGSNDMNHL